MHRQHNNNQSFGNNSGNMGANSFYSSSSQKQPYKPAGFVPSQYDQYLQRQQQGKSQGTSSSHANNQAFSSSSWSNHTPSISNFSNANSNSNRMKNSKPTHSNTQGFSKNSGPSGFMH